MPDRHVNCILCKGNRLQPLRKYDAGNLVKCRDCGLVFASSIPSLQELAEHYKRYPHFSGISQTTIKRYNELLDRFEKYRLNNRIIDVGCGEGFFLEQARKRGWEVYGTECVPHYIPICESKGITMNQGVLDTNNYKAGSFDIVTSFEVIEHLNYPAKEIGNFRSLLRNGGLLYLTTPNFDSLSRRIQGKSWSVIYYPDHLCYFSPASIRYAMKTYGFKKVSLLTTGISPDRIRQALSGKKGELNGHKDHKDKYKPFDMELQEKIEGNTLLLLIKGTVNRLLTLSGTGDGIKAMYEKV